jgi:hypothetical protein
MLRISGATPLKERAIDVQAWTGPKSSLRTGCIYLPADNPGTHFCQSWPDLERGAIPPPPLHTFTAQEEFYVINSACTAKYIRWFPYYFIRKTHNITFFLRTEVLYFIGSVINTKYLFYIFRTRDVCVLYLAKRNGICFALVTDDWKFCFRMEYFNTARSVREVFSLFANPSILLQWEFRIEEAFAQNFIKETPFHWTSYSLTVGNI